MRSWIFFGGGAFVLLSLLLGAAMLLPLETILLLTFGWILFLLEALVRVRVDWPTVAMACGLLLGFTGGLHWFFSWLYQAVTTPPATAPEDASAPEKRRWKAEWTAVSVLGVLLMFAAGISMVGLAHQVAWMFRSSEPWVQVHSEIVSRIRARETVERLGLGLLEYAYVQKALPAGATQDAQGRLLHGWMTSLLPYIETNSPVAGKLDEARLDLPWDDPANRELYQTPVYSYQTYRDYRYPESRRDEAGYALTDLAGNVSVLGRAEPFRMEEAAGGTSNTIFLGEVAQSQRPWGYPANWEDPREGLNQPSGGFSSYWSGGQVHFLMLDGSVQTLYPDVDQSVLEALATPGASEQDY